ncbi:MAG: hypothetical protein ACO23N_01450 [Opitutales bacterium]
MNRSLLLAATALIAAQASASQNAVTHFTLTSANGGASTLVNYSFTGSWLTGVVVQDPANLSALSGVYESVTSNPGFGTLYAPMPANGSNPGGSSTHFEALFTGAISGACVQQPEQLWVGQPR